MNERAPERPPRHGCWEWKTGPAPVKIGYEADFLVGSANPLEDLAALDGPIMIVSDGIVVVDRR